MSRILRIFAFVVGVFYAGNVLAAGYTCPTYKQYTSCASGYYMTSSASSTVHNGTSAVGNACRPCSVMGQYNGVDKYTCAGGTAAPVQKTVTVSYNLNNGTGTVPSATTCKFGESCTLNAGTTTAYYRAGYRLVGWSTSSSATSGSFSMTLMANTTVYAVWSKCASGTYKGASATAAATCTSMSYGYYGTGCDANDAACTGQAQCTGTTYCEDHIQQECPNPNDATHQRTTIPDAYKGSKFSSASVTAANGRGAASECRALVWYDPDTSVTSGQTVGLYEYVYLDDATMRYQGKVDVWAYDAVGPGYYLYGKGVCGAYAYYKSVAVCPIGAACLGKSKVLCDSSNQATVHTETFGLDVCSGGKTTTATGATACNATCSNATGANTWTTPTWSSSTKQILNKCAISTCSTGYTRGGTASSTATSSYTCAANCNKITLVGAYNGGSGTDLVVYKKTGSTTWYSNSTCTTAITKVSGTLPTKQYASYGGHFNTTAASGGMQCVDGTGLLSDSGSCNVNGDIKLYPQFSCWREYLGSGQVISGACTGTVYPITLRNYNGTATHSTIYEKYATGWYSNSTATTTLSKAAVPTRTGYTFRGFYSTTQTDLTASGGTGTRRITADGTLPSNTTFASNTSLYAAWATNCVQPSNGKCTLTINSAGTATYTTTCNAGYYISGAGTYKPTCTPCGDGTYSAGGTATSCTTCPGEYTHSDGARSAIGNCYLTTTAGKYVKTAGAGQVTCDDPTTFYYPGGAKVYYGKTGGEVALDLGEWNAVNVGGTCADKEYCPAGYYGDASGWCEPIPAGNYPEGCPETDDDDNGIGCGGYAPCSGLPGVSVTGGTYTSAAQSKNSKACKYTAPAKTIDGCATVTSNTVSYTGSEWPASTYTVTPSAGYVASNNNTASATCQVGIWTIMLNATTNGGTGGTSAVYEKYNTGWYSNAAATTAMSTITIPTKTNSVFNGYYTATTGGTQRIGRDGSLPSNTTFTANTTLYAQYSACAACTKGNGVAACSLAVKDNTCTYSATCSTYYKNPTCTSDGKCSCTGNTFYIKYNAGGGTGNAPTSPTVCTYGSGNCWAPANTYTRTGYTFAQWGDGEQAVPAGQEISTWFGHTDGETITLTAMWTVNSVKCDAGKYLPSNTLTCKSCDAGYYCAGGTYSFSTSAIQGRTACTAGTYNPNTGSSAVSACVPASAGYYVPSAAATSQTACTGRTKFSAAGATECSTVSSGYYTTGCNTSGNACTGQTQCTGATYCASGIQNSCPAQTSGWTRNGGTGWTAVTQCNQTKTGAAISSYCAGGVLQQNATSATTWGETKIATALTAKQGSIVNGQTCSQCGAGTYSLGDTATTCGACPAGDSGWTVTSPAGSSSFMACYETQTPANCASGTVKRAAVSSTTYSSEITLVTQLKSKAGYYASATATSCTVCPAGSYCPASATAATACAAGTYNSNTGSSASSACVKASAGYYVPSAAATSQTACTGATYTETTGATSCTACPTVDASVTPGGTGSYGYYNLVDNTSVHSKKDGCVAYFNGLDLEHGHVNNYRCYWNVNSNSYDFYCTVARGELSCDAGYFTSRYGASSTDATEVGFGSLTDRTQGGRAELTTTCRDAETGYYSPDGDVLRTQCPTGYRDGPAGATEADCKISVAGGKYLGTAKGTTLTTCPANNYCPAAMVAYGSTNSPIACPTAADHKRAVVPTAYYASAIAATSLSTSTGRSAITQCQVLNTYNGTRGSLYDYLTYDPQSNRYDVQGTVLWFSVKPGYYLTGDTGCGTYAYYARAVECDKNAYCPGKDKVTCNSTNKAEVHVEKFGLELCSALGNGKYATSDGGASATSTAACYLTTTATNFVKTANAAEEKCTAGGYCAGGTQVNWGSTGGRTACNAGTYNPSTGSSAASACVKADAGYYVPSTGATSQTACTGATYTETTGATSCTACPTATGATSYSYFKSGNIHSAKSGCYAFFGSLAINNGTLSKYHCYWDTTNNVYNTTCGVGRADLKCNAKYYAPAFGGNTTTSTYLYKTKADITSKVCQTVGGGYYSGADVLDRTACPTGYGNGAAGAVNTDCQMKVAGGKYVKVAAESTASGVCDAGYAKAEHYVNYNSTSSCTACTGATYADTTGQASCTACPTAKTYASVVTGYSYWNSGKTGDHNKKGGCYANFGASVLDYGNITASHCYVGTGDDYGNGGASCWVNVADLKCNGGYYNAAANGGSSQPGYTTRASLLTNACVAVGAGYYSAADVLTRSQCPTGQTTIGYGAGADEAADCGRILHIGDDKVYLRNTKKTTPSLNVQIGDTKYYGDMTSGTTKGKLRVKSGTTTYSVHDDSM